MRARVLANGAVEALLETVEELFAFIIILRGW